MYIIIEKTYKGSYKILYTIYLNFTLKKIYVILTKTSAIKETVIKHMEFITNIEFKRFILDILTDDEVKKLKFKYRNTNENKLLSGKKNINKMMGLFDKYLLKKQIETNNKIIDITTEYMVKKNVLKVKKTQMVNNDIKIL